MCVRIWYLIILTTWLPKGNNIVTRYSEIETWTTHFGHHLWNLNQAITLPQEIKDEYQSATFEEINGIELVKEIALDIEKFLDLKVEAVKRIADTAENAAKGYQYDQNIKPKESKEEWKHERYPSAKYLNESIWPLEENDHFKVPVSLDFSTIHVQTNVNDEDPIVLNGIEATKVLDAVFRDNYKHDPNLYWQYFGGAEGYLRNYPGVKWPTPYTTQAEDEHPADTYDNCMRLWYIEAATSPKDIIILLDISGSMHGLRYAIAKYVVGNILDSLTQNDFVGVFKFSSDVENVVPCFNRSLVPAYGENVQLIKESVEGIDMINKTNFSLALSFSFELLQEYNFSGRASQCNQAIMIVGDGAEEKSEDVFQKYDPDHRIRLFTYLIGREVTEYEEMMWMACNQRGLHSHIFGLSQVPVEVKKYIPVMAQPLAYQRVHPVIWTTLYADVTNKREMYEQEDMDKCELLTTVAVPAYNQSIVEVSTTEGNITTIEKIQKDELLGVAGVDVPIKDIRKLIPIHKLGVNGYPFILNNHGNLLIHPYLQPFYKQLLNSFQLIAGIETVPLVTSAKYNKLLKVGYGHMDLIDVEFGLNDEDPWTRDPDLLEIRSKMIQRQTDSHSATVKVSFDQQKRVTIRENSYFFTPIALTPFSLAIVFPYGNVRIKPSDENILNNLPTVISSLENDDKWSVHPDWVYCEDRPSRSFNATPEQYLLKFLKYIDEHKSDEPRKDDKSNATFYCDVDLMVNLIFDVSATAPFASIKLKDNKELQNARELGLKNLFIATHSGLTRWIDLEDHEFPYAYINNRAVDELWYRRAVDYNLEDKDAFVFSVPLTADNYSDTFVTASHAIFLQDEANVLPAAVVGLRFGHSLFTDLVFNSTHGFDCGDQQCDKPCSSLDISCYILDDNGYIIVSENTKDTGLFFGNVEGEIMRLLISEGIYEGGMMYDHQGTCGVPGKRNSASFFTSPFYHIAAASAWLLKKVALLWVHYNMYTLWDISWLSSLADGEPHHAEQKIDEDMSDPCSLIFKLYVLNASALEVKPLTLNVTNCILTGCDKHLMIQKIPFTNLVMVATDSNCECTGAQFDDTDPTEIFFEKFNLTQCDLLKLELPVQSETRCYNHHAKEAKIMDCGSGCNLQAKFGLVLITVMTLLT